MILKTTDVKHFMELMHNRDIICFGAGNYLDQFFNYCPSLIDRIKFIIDNSPNKWNTFKKISDQKKEIISPKQLPSIVNDNTSILITVGRTGVDIVEQLSNMEELKNQEVFWSMFILRELERVRYLHIRPLPSDFKITKEPVIPRIIHYCWVGGNPIPERLQGYIDGWKRLCPDYEIIRWDEKNYDVEKHDYMKQAYAAKKWAFVSDYMRKDIIYQNGGIYLDVDVEMLKRPDDLLYQDGFCGTEMARKGGYRVNSGLGFGARKNLPIIKELRDIYNGENFNFTELNTKISPEYETEVLERHGFKNNGEYQMVAGMTIYPIEVLSGLCGKLSSEDNAFFTENTYLFHRTAGSWNRERNHKYEVELQKLYKMCKRA